MGGVHGDAVRPVAGTYGNVGTDQTLSGAFYVNSHSGYGLPMSGGSTAYGSMDTSRVVPVASKNQPRAWGALACVYLGLPAS